jgi:hypothetical protein
MLRPAYIIGLLGLAIGVSAGPSQTSFDSLVSSFQKRPLSPYVIPDILQKLALENKVSAKFSAVAYANAFKYGFFSDQLFYTDLLTGVDVIANAWASRSGATLKTSGYQALICFFCFPLPGCRPKSTANQVKILRTREPLLVGSYGSAVKREDIVARLTPRFLQSGSLEEIDLQSVDVEEYMNIKDILK